MSILCPPGGVLDLGGSGRGHPGRRPHGPLTLHLRPRAGQGSTSPLGPLCPLGPELRACREEGQLPLGGPPRMGESLPLGRMFSLFGKHPLDATEAGPGDGGLGPHLPGAPQFGGSSGQHLGVEGQGGPGPLWDRHLSPPRAPHRSGSAQTPGCPSSSKGGGRAGAWARAGAGRVTS